jgi:hypothetical protein
MNKIEVIKGIPRFSRQEVQTNKDWIYLFSDNADRTSVTKGTAGYPAKMTWYEEKYGKYVFPRKSHQRIRGIHNAYPITTLKDKHHGQWTDRDFDRYKELLDDDIRQIKEVFKWSNSYKGIRILDKKFGDDVLSAMKFTSKKCYSYLVERLKELNIDNESLEYHRFDERIGGSNYQPKLDAKEVMQYKWISNG